MSKPGKAATATDVVPQIPPLPPVVGQAAARLRKAIMTGGLRPGQKLVEATLCQELQISRPSLREVLRIMEKERLIELIPNRGPFVAKLGWKEIEDIHDVWAMLTSEAVYRFTERAGPEDLAVIRQAERQLAAALEGEEALDQLAATNSMFGAILSHCGNQVLIDIVYSLVSRLNFLRAQALRYEGWGHLCLHEVQEIISAIEAKNPLAARQATRRHIDSACAAAKQVALLADARKAAPRGTGRPRSAPGPRASKVEASMRKASSVER